MSAAAAAPKPYRVLDLCSGTGSIQKALPPSVTVVSVDIDRKVKATHTVDLILWDYAAAYPVGHFDAIWASPPCNAYSVVNQLNGGAKPAALERADAMVRRCREIIAHFNPRVSFYENPAGGELKRRRLLNDVLYRDFAYCQFGKPYKKETRIWSDNIRSMWSKPCPGKGFCKQMVGGRHKMNVGCLDEDKTTRRRDTVVRGRLVHPVPPALIMELFKAADPAHFH